MTRSAALVLLLCSAAITAQAQTDSFSVAIGVRGDDATMRGLMRVAAGAGPHPTVVFLHGFPGSEDPAIARYLQAAGFNAMAVMLRGRAPSDGNYSVDGTAQDAAAMVAYLRSDSARRAFRADPTRIALVGGSAGSYAALQATASDPGIRCVGVIVPFNWAIAGIAGRTDTAVRRQFDGVFQVMTSGPAPRIRADRSFVERLIANAEAYDLARAGALLRDRKVFLLGAAQDATAELPIHFHPLVAATRSAPGASVRDTVVADGHNLPQTWEAAFAAIVRWLRSDCWATDNQ